MQTYTHLGGEISDDVGHVAAPQGDHALVLDGAGEALADALVGLRQAALLDHLVLVLDQQLDALDGGSGGLGHTGGHASHHEVLRRREGEERGDGDSCAVREPSACFRLPIAAATAAAAAAAWAAERAHERAGTPCPASGSQLLLRDTHHKEVLLHLAFSHLADTPPSRQ
eukprot:1153022-Pelagomonas_calceolata.AAC.3